MTSKKIEKLLKKAEINVVVEQDIERVHGNAYVEDEADILRRLDSGDVWAWACVKVVATLEIDDTQYRGESEWLGACSYESEKDFRAPGGMFDDMKKTALDELCAQLQNRPLDPSDIRITTDAQRLALADLVNRTLKYRTPEIEAIRSQLYAALRPSAD